MLFQRLLTAIVLIPLVIIGLFFLPLNYFIILMIVICGLAAWEWAQFLGIHSTNGRLIFAGLFVVFLAAIYYVPYLLSIQNNIFKFILISGGLWWLLALIMVVFYPKSAMWWKTNCLYKLLFAVFTLAPFLIGLIELRQLNYQQNSYDGAFCLLYVFVLVWATDSGAYFAGRALGKHKLAPFVSPGKTLEGLMGGVATSIAVCWLVYLFNFFDVQLWHFVFCSFITILVSVLGDLTESMFKREANIKDSSNLIPGHGGVLDRIDSLTSAIPIFAFTFILLG